MPRRRELWRGRRKTRWKGDERWVAGRWGQMEKRSVPLRQVTWAAWEEKEEVLGRGGKGKGPSAAWLVSGFFQKEIQQREKIFGGILEEKKNT